MEKQVSKTFGELINKTYDLSKEDIVILECTRVQNRDRERIKPLLTMGNYWLFDYQGNLAISVNGRQGDVYILARKVKREEPDYSNN